MLWYPSYFFCCGLVPTVAMISIIHPKIERKFCFLNKPNVIQIQKTFTQMHANFHRFHKKTNIFCKLNNILTMYKDNRLYTFWTKLGKSVNSGAFRFLAFPRKAINKDVLTFTESFHSTNSKVCRGAKNHSSKVLAWAE